MAGGEPVSDQCYRSKRFGGADQREGLERAAATPNVTR